MGTDMVTKAKEHQVRSVLRVHVVHMVVFILTAKVHIILQTGSSNKLENSVSILLVMHYSFVLACMHGYSYYNLCTLTILDFHCCHTPSF